uniref:Uncharacterized protein n=1 Tax=Pseudo-nitzschia australis TaxID=44445 RepID=A0A7S4AEA9_9STRA
MVERKEDWNACPKVKASRPVIPLLLPIRPPVGCSMLTRARYDQDHSTWMEYAHLVKVGTDKLLTWFGKDVFETLHIRCQLPSHLTPRDLLDYLTEVYAPKELHQFHVNKVKAMAKSNYNSTKPVKTYFATLQHAKDNAVLLDIAYSDTQLMYYVMDQFEKQLGQKRLKKLSGNGLNCLLKLARGLHSKCFGSKPSSGAKT